MKTKQKKITIPLSKAHLLDHECRLISLEERIRRLEYPTVSGIDFIHPTEDIREKIKDLIYCFDVETSPNIDTDVNEIADEILSLIQQEVRECIGEDEKPLVKVDYPEMGKLNMDFKQFDETIIKNKVRSEIKENLKERGLV